MPYVRALLTDEEARMLHGQARHRGVPSAELAGNFVNAGLWTIQCEPDCPGCRKDGAAR